MRPIAMIIAIMSLSTVVNAAPATTNARCTNLQARCAIEAGGSCNYGDRPVALSVHFAGVHGPLQRLHLARSALSLTFASGRLTSGSHPAADSQLPHK